MYYTRERQDKCCGKCEILLVKEDNANRWQIRIYDKRNILIASEIYLDSKIALAEYMRLRMLLNRILPRLYDN